MVYGDWWHRRSVFVVHRSHRDRERFLQVDRTQYGRRTSRARDPLRKLPVQAQLFQQNQNSHRYCFSEVKYFFFFFFENKSLGARSDRLVRGKCGGDDDMKKQINKLSSRLNIKTSLRWTDSDVFEKNERLYGVHFYI